MREGRTKKARRDSLIIGTGMLSRPQNNSLKALVITITNRKANIRVRGPDRLDDHDKREVSKSSVSGTQSERNREEAK
jgi:hypothetical protein